MRTCNKIPSHNAVGLTGLKISGSVLRKRNEKKRKKNEKLNALNSKIGRCLVYLHSLSEQERKRMLHIYYSEGSSIHDILPDGGKSIGQCRGKESTVSKK